MPVPKRKVSKRRRNKRHANKGLDVQAITHCPNSGSPVMPHTVCLESGYYKGVKVLRTKQDRLEARGKKREAQQAAQKERQDAVQSQIAAKQAAKEAASNKDEAK
ncbi:MAG: 50S ribosomal protein L32 [Epsilonproteobacteria bacterium]|nr:50S ribosomal protein L32 [Campylobacterota bacterium]|tara:strand:- start:897 stop:1211 length:315 start_codon:yes stop_codon:yes gene_type:complete